MIGFHSMGRRTAHRLACAAVMAGIATLTAACNGSSSDSSPPVAKVGNQVLTSAELDLMLRRSVAGEPTPEAKWAAVERWVDRELLYREALKRGIDRKPEVKLQTQTAVRELVINALLEDAFRDKLAVTDEEIEKYYKERRTLFRRSETTIQVRQIVLDNSREARSLARQLRRDPARFEELARSRSTDPSSTDGGELGYLSKATAYNAAIWQALQRLSDHEISRPISTDAGWHILQVEDRRPAGSIKTLDEVRLDIINRLRSAKRLALINKLIEQEKLQEPYAIYEEMLGPRYQKFPTLPVSADTLDGTQ